MPQPYQLSYDKKRPGERHKTHAQQGRAVLSHCAIVAREYRMPCVVGTVNGTQRIKDGQMLTVDGAKGIVRIDG